MALYTVVDGGYHVEVFKSFETLWESVRQGHRHTDADSPLWLDENESVPLTKATLRKELKEQGYACVSEDGYGADWTLKIQQQ